MTGLDVAVAVASGEVVGSCLAGLEHAARSSNVARIAVALKIRRAGRFMLHDLPFICCGFQYSMFRPLKTGEGNLLLLLMICYFTVISSYCLVPRPISSAWRSVIVQSVSGAEVEK